MMADNVTRLTAEEITAIDAAVERSFYVEKRADGTNVIELSADYRDTNEFLLQTAYDHREDAVKPASEDMSYEPENNLLYTLQDQIHESYENYIEETAYEILTSAGFDPHDSFDERSFAAKEYLQEKYCFTPPYDHFLDQKMKVNIMLQTPDDLSFDHGLIKDQFIAMAHPKYICSPKVVRELLSEDSSLKLLVEQQGYTMADLSKTARDYVRAKTRRDMLTADRPRFLTSLCEELANTPDSDIGCITVLAEVSMNEFAEMMKPGSEISMPCDSTVGIFDPWNGVGSFKGIKLAKALVFHREDIFDIQIEGVALDFGYTVKVGNKMWGFAPKGMRASRWHKPNSISSPVAARKPGLDSMISSAQQRAAVQEKTTPGRDDLTH